MPTSKLFPQINNAPFSTDDDRGDGHHGFYFYGLQWVQQSLRLNQTGMNTIRDKSLRSKIYGNHLPGCQKAINKHT
jgi:hypothetical protein